MSESEESPKVKLEISFFGENPSDIYYIQPSEIRNGILTMSIGSQKEYKIESKGRTILKIRRA
jgi:hypothetical protein